jgi:hypothetical protein
LRLAGALRAVVFLAATGPPRGKTLGLPEGSCKQGWQINAHLGAFFANKVVCVSQCKIFASWPMDFKKFDNFGSKSAHYNHFKCQKNRVVIGFFPFSFWFTFCKLFSIEFIYFCIQLDQSKKIIKKSL